MIISALIKQKSYERVEHVLRRHPVTFIPQTAMFITLAAVPIALYFLFNNLYPTILNGDIVYPIAVLVGSMYFLSIFLFFFAQFITFYLDVWIITNDRIIDVEQVSLFSRSISEVDLFRIQDVTSQTHGFFATFFKYGDVEVKTASMNVDIIARNVPHPNKIREHLIHLSHEDRKYHYNQPGNK